MSKGKPEKKMTLAERRRAKLDEAIDGPKKPKKDAPKPAPKGKKKP